MKLNEEQIASDIRAALEAAGWSRLKNDELGHAITATVMVLVEHVNAALACPGCDAAREAQKEANE